MYTDLKTQINKLFLTKWQQCWNNNINNKLFQIKPTFGGWRPVFRKSKSHYISIADWPHKSHSFILKQEQPPQCLTCQTPYTIKHGLVECGALTITRERHFKTDNMRDMFENVHINDVLSFLIEKYNTFHNSGKFSHPTYQSTKYK